MNTPDITHVQAAAFAAAASGYAAGMRGLDFAAFVLLCAAAVIADAGVRRGRAGVAEAAQYNAAAEDDEI